MTSERRSCLVGLAMAASILGVMALPLLSGQVYAKDDLGSFHLPTRFFYAQSLARGESFLWSPSLFCGFYLHGEGQAGLLHPLHLLLYASLPLTAAFNLELLLSYVALLPGMFFLLRRWELRRDAAMLGALIFTFSGFNMSHFVHPNMVAVFAHAPWLLLAQEVALRGDPRSVAAARLAVGLLTASQVLLGHPQAMWLSGVLEGSYFLFRRAGTRGRRWGVVEAKLLGVLIGSVQLLPTWEAVGDSVRADAAAFRYRHSLEPANLLQLVGPSLSTTGVFGRYPQEFWLYTGALACALVAWLLVRWRTLTSQRPLAKAALVLAAVSLVLALGERAYLYRLQAALPLVGLFESSARYIVLFHFALAVAGAIAFADLAALAEDGFRVPWSQLRSMWVLPAASASVAVAALWLRGRPQLSPEIAGQLAPTLSILAGPALILIASCLVLAAARGARAAPAALVVFTALDQGAYGLGHIRQPFPPLEVDRFVRGQAAPPEDSAHRVQSDINILSMRGARLAGGYAAFAQRRAVDPFDGTRLRIAGVRWVQTRTPWAATREARSAASFEAAVKPETRISHDALGRASSWREVREPLPRAWLVSQERVSSDPGADLASIDPTATALVAEQLSLQAGPPGEVTVVADRPGDVRLRAEASARQLLVLSESWHAGWAASIDGAARPARRVFGDFVGVVVEAGAHDVAFRFQPESFRGGARLSLLGLGLLLASTALRRNA